MPNKRKRYDDNNDPSGPPNKRPNNSFIIIIPDMSNNNNYPPTPTVSDSGSDSELEDDEDDNIPAEEENTFDENFCVNPLCDHKDGEMSTVENIEINCLDDLINLGKMFHCKRFTSYRNINMRILCNLVAPLTELNNMVGMHQVKREIINQIIFFLQGLNNNTRCWQCTDCIYGLPCAITTEDMMHTVITGPPGVGKSALGQIMGKIYNAMGILDSEAFHVARRSDLIGKYVGHTAVKTQQFIDKCKGGVMFIDEAYSLGNKEGRDTFSKECIDTINQNLTERRDFLCIIAGYKESLDQCFFNYNEGLRRRFTFRYNITGYTGEELMQIFLKKVTLGDWHFDEDHLHDLGVFFSENYQYFPNYGGDVETLFLNCKIVYARRNLFCDSDEERVLEMLDINRAFANLIENREYKPPKKRKSKRYKGWDLDFKVF